MQEEGQERAGKKARGKAQICSASIEVRVPIVLVFNPGSASLKFEVIEVLPGQKIASEGKKLVSAAIEGLGKNARLLTFEGRDVAHSEPDNVSNIADTGGFEGLVWPRWFETELICEASLAAVGGCRPHKASRRSRRAR